MATKQTIWQRKYDDAHCARVFLKLNKEYDKDILEALATKPSKQGYIKDLIRADLEKNKKS